MLSIGKLANGQADYYLSLAGARVDRSASVSSGVEDYYTGGAEPPGRWTGDLAAELGLGGQVKAEDLKRQLEVQGDGLPEQLGRRTVPGYDLTFSAPKSVSVVFGIADVRVREAVARAHRVAVDAALGYVACEAVRVRRGHAGKRQLAAEGIIAAAFDHRTSRAGDPQLHTHVLIANRSRGVDGRWSALDSRRLYRHAKTAGFVYQAVLRSELTDRLGLGWTPRTNGTGEIAGIPPTVLRAFSRRRAEIEQELERAGAAGRTAAQTAALATRRSKDYDVTPEQLRPGWRARAEELGLSRTHLDELLRHPPVPERRIDQRELFAELASPTGMTARRSTFTRRDLLQVLAERSDPSERVSVGGLQLLADAFLASDVVTRVTDVGETQYSVNELVDRERRLLTLGATVDPSVPVATSEALATALAARPSLSPEQRLMVERLTGGDRFVQVVVGKAGTGKTFALDAAREAWERSAITVIGAAVARRAARELEEGAGIRSTSVRMLLDETRLRPLPAGCVVVVDEAAMVPTRSLHDLAERVRSAHGRLVLVGDFRQLPEIQAGGAFAALAVRGGAIELRENWRQRRSWERRALEVLRAGDSGSAIAAYRANGELTVAPSAELIRQRLVTDWWQARGSSEALMIAFRRSDVADLNRRARELMRENGHLSGPEIEVGEAAFCAGDHVVIRRGSRRLNIVNGDRGVIRAVGEHSIEVELKGRRVILDGRFLAAPGSGRPPLQHAYAVTGHIAQGLTTDRTFVLGTNRLFREWGYVAMSRGRLSNRMYAVVGEPSAREEIAPGRRQLRPLEDLVDRLERSERQRTTLDERYAAEFAALSDEALRGQLAILRLARVKNRADAELRARVSLAREEVYRRAALQSRAAALEAPSHLAGLGEPPDGLAGRERWRRSAADIEAYRIEHGVNDAVDPIGARPADPKQLALWREAQRGLGRQRDVGREL